MYFTYICRKWIYFYYWFAVHFVCCGVWINNLHSLNYTACNALEFRKQWHTQWSVLAIPLDAIVVVVVVIERLRRRFSVDLFRRDIHRAQIMRYNRTCSEITEQIVINGKIYGLSSFTKVAFVKNTKKKKISDRLCCCPFVHSSVCSSRKGRELLRYKPS